MRTQTFILLGAALVTAAASCKTAKSGDSEVLSSKLLPMIDSSSLPAELRKSFDFCPDAKDLNFKNATYLAYLSANQYTHFGQFAPLLGDLGFGDPGQAQLWAKRFHKLQLMRAEAAGNTGGAADALKQDFQQRFGADWRSDPQLANDVTAATPVAYEAKLIGEARAGEKIQFFSGGSLESDGKTFNKQSVQAVWGRASDEEAGGSRLSRYRGR